MLILEPLVGYSHVTQLAFYHADLGDLGAGMGRYLRVNKLDVDVLNIITRRCDEGTFHGWEATVYLRRQEPPRPK